MPALMMKAEMSTPRIPSKETPQSSITAAETNVAMVMMASKSASEPEAMSASLLSFSPCFFTNQPSRSLTTMATMMTISVLAV